MTKLISSALYVDFDNVYSNILSGYGQQAANLFTNGIQNWISYLSTVGLPDGDKRIFRKQIVYANPAIYGRYRHNFTSNGFRFIDCPVLTAQGKTATDAFLITDIVRDSILLYKYEDFVVISSDADFSSVLLHLNEMCKNSILVSVGPASYSYTHIATYNVNTNAFVNSFGVSNNTGVQQSGVQQSNTNTPTEPAAPASGVTNTVKRYTPIIKNNESGNESWQQQRNDLLRLLRLPLITQEEYKFAFDMATKYVAANKKARFYVRAMIRSITKEYPNISREQILQITGVVTYDKVRASNLMDILFGCYKSLVGNSSLGYDKFSEILTKA